MKILIKTVNYINSFVNVTRRMRRVSPFADSFVTVVKLLMNSIFVFHLIYCCCNNYNYLHFLSRNAYNINICNMAKSIIMLHPVWKTFCQYSVPVADTMCICKVRLIVVVVWTSFEQLLDIYNEVFSLFLYRTSKLCLLKSSLYTAQMDSRMYEILYIV